MKYQFIEAHRQEYPVTMMCRVLEVARNGYYQWRRQPLSARKVADGVLLMHIEDVFEQDGRWSVRFANHTCSHHSPSRRF